HYHPLLHAWRDDLAAKSSAGRRSGGQRNRLEGAHQRGFELAAHLAQDVIGLLAAHRGLVGPRLDQRSEDIRDRQEADDVCNDRRSQRIGIAAAVEKFMMVANGIEDFGIDTSYGLQGIEAEYGMLAHDPFFLGIEPGRLVENRQRYVGLANIMQRCRKSEAINVGTGKAEIDREARGHARDQQAVLERAFVML